MAHPKSLIGPNSRLRELDGLRGLASLAVLSQHTFLTFSAFSDASNGIPPTHDPLASLLSYSPLHLVWAGGESVYLFFVLSGVALTRSVLSSQIDWERYYPARVVRLLLPVAAALALLVISVMIIPRDASGLSSWLEYRKVVPDLTSLTKDLTLVGGASYVLGVLWSLQWELIFSLALPLYVVIARRTPLWLGLALSLFGVLAGSVVAVDSVRYLSMFAVGSLLGQHWEAIQHRLDSIRTWEPVVQWALGSLVTVAGVLLFVSHWWLPSVLPEIKWLDSTPINFAAVSNTLIVIGCTVLTVAVTVVRPISRLLRSRVVQWFGTISFSLYLVHEQIVVGTAFATDNLHGAVVLSAALSIPAAWLFYLLVERHSHTLARRIRSGPKTAPNQ